MAIWAYPSTCEVMSLTLPRDNKARWARGSAPKFRHDLGKSKPCRANFRCEDREYERKERRFRLHHFLKIAQLNETDFRASAGPCAQRVRFLGYALISFSAG